MDKADEDRIEAATILATVGKARCIRRPAKGIFFSQGDSADSLFFLQNGRAKLTALSMSGKEATVLLLSGGDFMGEEALLPVTGYRECSATAITVCDALQFSPEAMAKLLHNEHRFSAFFLSFLLKRSVQAQADLVDQLFNSSEKRLARVLLLMAGFGKPGEAERRIPKITQAELAELVGTTRPRISFFMNRFRKLGLIEYSDRITVHKALLDVVLNDRLPNR